MTPSRCALAQFRNILLLFEVADEHIGGPAVRSPAWGALVIGANP